MVRFIPVRATPYIVPDPSSDYSNHHIPLTNIQLLSDAPVTDLHSVNNDYNPNINLQNPEFIDHITAKPPETNDSTTLAFTTVSQTDPFTPPTPTNTPPVEPRFSPTQTPLPSPTQLPMAVLSMTHLKNFDPTRHATITSTPPIIPTPLIYTMDLNLDFKPMVIDVTVFDRTDGFTPFSSQAKSVNTLGKFDTMRHNGQSKTDSLADKNETSESTQQMPYNPEFFHYDWSFQQTTAFPGSSRCSGPLPFSVSESQFDQSRTQSVGDDFSSADSQPTNINQAPNSSQSTVNELSIPGIGRHTYFEWIVSKMIADIYKPAEEGAVPAPENNDVINQDDLDLDTPDNNSPNANINQPYGSNPSSKLESQSTKTVFESPFSQRKTRSPFSLASTKSDSFSTTSLPYSQDEIDAIWPRNSIHTRDYAATPWDLPGLEEFDPNLAGNHYYNLPHYWTRAGPRLNLPFQFIAMLIPSHTYRITIRVTPIPGKVAAYPNPDPTYIHILFRRPTYQNYARAFSPKHSQTIPTHYERPETVPPYGSPDPKFGDVNSRLEITSSWSPDFKPTVWFSTNSSSISEYCKLYQQIRRLRVRYPDLDNIPAPWRKERAHSGLNPYLDDDDGDDGANPKPHDLNWGRFINKDGYILLPIYPIIGNIGLYEHAGFESNDLNPWDYYISAGKLPKNWTLDPSSDSTQFWSLNAQTNGNINDRSSDTGDGFDFFTQAWEGRTGNKPNNNIASDKNYFNHASAQKFKRPTPHSTLSSSDQTSSTSSPFQITKFDWYFPAPVYTSQLETGQSVLQIDHNARSNLPWIALSIPHLSPDQLYKVGLRITFQFDLEAPVVTSQYSSRELDQMFWCYNTIYWTQTTSPQSPTIEVQHQFNLPNVVLDTRSLPTVLYGNREYPVVFNISGTFAHYNPFLQIGTNRYLDFDSSPQSDPPSSTLDPTDTPAVTSTSNSGQAPRNPPPMYLWSCYTEVYSTPKYNFPYYRGDQDLGLSDNPSSSNKTRYSAALQKYRNCFSDLDNHLADVFPSSVSFSHEDQLKVFQSLYTGDATLSGTMSIPISDESSDLEIDLLHYFQHQRHVTLQHGLPLAVHFGANVTQFTPDSLSILSQLGVSQITMLVSAIYQGAIDTRVHNIRLVPQNQTVSLFSVSLMALQTLVSDNDPGTTIQPTLSAPPSYQPATQATIPSNILTILPINFAASSEYVEKQMTVQMTLNDATFLSSDTQVNASPIPSFPPSSEIRFLAVQARSSRLRDFNNLRNQVNQTLISGTVPQTPLYTQQQQQQMQKQQLPSSNGNNTKIKATSFSPMAELDFRTDLSTIMSEITALLQDGGTSSPLLHSSPNSRLLGNELSALIRKNKDRLKHKTKSIYNELLSILSTPKNNIQPQHQIFADTSQDPLQADPYTHYQPLVSLNRQILQELIQQITDLASSPDAPDPIPGTFYVAWRQIDPLDIDPNFYIKKTPAPNNDGFLSAKEGDNDDDAADYADGGGGGVDDDDDDDGDGDDDDDDDDDSDEQEIITTPKLILQDPFSQYLRVSPINLIVDYEYVLEMCQFEVPLTPFEQRVWQFPSKSLNFTDIQVNSHLSNTLDRLFIPRPAGIFVQTDQAHTEVFKWNGYDGKWGRRAPSISPEKYRADSKYGRMADSITNHDQIEEFIQRGYASEPAAVPYVRPTKPRTRLNGQGMMGTTETTSSTPRAEDFVSIRRPSNCYRVKFRVADQDTAFCTVQVTLPHRFTARSSQSNSALEPIILSKMDQDLNGIEDRLVDRWATPPDGFFNVTASCQIYEDLQVEGDNNTDGTPPIDESPFEDELENEMVVDVLGRSRPLHLSSKHRSKPQSIHTLLDHTFKSNPHTAYYEQHQGQKQQKQQKQHIDTFPLPLQTGTSTDNISTDSSGTSLIWKISPISSINADFATTGTDASYFSTTANRQFVAYRFTQSISSSISLPRGDYAILAYDSRSDNLVYRRQITLSPSRQCPGCLSDAVKFTFDMIEATIETPMRELSDGSETPTTQSREYQHTSTSTLTKKTTTTNISQSPSDHDWFDFALFATTEKDFDFSTISALSRSQREVADLYALGIKLVQTIAVGNIETLSSSKQVFVAQLDDFIQYMEQQTVKFSLFFSPTQFHNGLSASSSNGNNASPSQLQSTLSSTSVYWFPYSPYQLHIYKSLFSTPSLISLGVHNRALANLFAVADNLIMLFSELPLSQGYSLLNDGSTMDGRSIKVLDYRYYLSLDPEYSKFRTNPIPHFGQYGYLADLTQGLVSSSDGKVSTVEIGIAEIIALTTDAIAAYISAIYQLHMPPLQSPQHSSINPQQSTTDPVLSAVVSETSHLDTSSALFSFAHLSSFYTRLYFAPKLYAQLLDSNLISSTVFLEPDNDIAETIGGKLSLLSDHDSNINENIKSSKYFSQPLRHQQHRPRLFTPQQQASTETFSLPQHPLPFKAKSIATQIALQMGLINIYTIPIVLTSMQDYGTEGISIINKNLEGTVNPTFLSIPAPGNLYSVQTPPLIQRLQNDQSNIGQNTAQAVSESKIISLKVSDNFNLALFYSDYAVVRPPIWDKTSNWTPIDEAITFKSDFIEQVTAQSFATPFFSTSSSPSHQTFKTQATSQTKTYPAPLFLPIMMSPYTLSYRHPRTDAPIDHNPSVFVNNKLEAQQSHQSDGASSQNMDELNHTFDFQLTPDIVAVNTDRTYQSLHLLLAYLTSNTEFDPRKISTPTSTTQRQQAQSSSDSFESWTTTSISTTILNLLIEYNPFKTAAFQDTNSQLSQDSDSSRFTPQQTSSTNFYYDEPRCKFNPYLRSNQSCTLTLTQFTPSLSLTTLSTWSRGEPYWTSAAGLAMDSSEDPLPQHASIFSSFFQFSTNLHNSELLSRHPNAEIASNTAPAVKALDPESFLESLDPKRPPSQSALQNMAKSRLKKDTETLHSLFSTKTSLGTGSISLLPNLSSFLDPQTGSVPPLFDIDSVYYFDSQRRTMRWVAPWNYTSTMYPTPESSDVKTQSTHNRTAAIPTQKSKFVPAKLQGGTDGFKPLADMSALASNASPILNWFAKPPHIAQFNRPYPGANTLYTPNIRCEQMRYNEHAPETAEWTQDGCTLLGMTPIHFICFCDSSFLVRLHTRAISNEFAQYILYLPLLILALAVLSLFALYPRDLRLTRASLLRAALKWQHATFQLHNYPYLVYTYGAQYGRKVAEADFGLFTETVNFSLTQTIPTQEQIVDNNEIIHHPYLNDSLNFDIVPASNGSTDRNPNNNSSSDVSVSATVPWSTPSTKLETGSGSSTPTSTISLKTRTKRPQNPTPPITPQQNAYTIPNLEQFAHNKGSSSSPKTTPIIIGRSDTQQSIIPPMTHTTTNEPFGEVKTFSTTTSSQHCVQCDKPLVQYHQLFGNLEFFGTNWNLFKPTKSKDSSNAPSSTQSSSLSNRQNRSQQQSQPHPGVFSNRYIKDTFSPKRLGKKPDYNRMKKRGIFHSIMTSPFNPITYLPLPTPFRVSLGLSADPYESSYFQSAQDLSPQKDIVMPNRCWRCFLLAGMGNFHSLFRLIYHHGPHFNGVPLSHSAAIFTLSILTSLAFPATILNSVGLYWTIAITTAATCFLQLIFHHVLHLICANRIDLNVCKYGFEVARYHATGISPYLFYAPVKHHEKLATQLGPLLPAPIPQYQQIQTTNSPPPPPPANQDIAAMLTDSENLVAEEMPLWARKLNKKYRDEGLAGLTSVSSVRDRPALQLIALLYHWDNANNRGSSPITTNSTPSSSVQPHTTNTYHINGDFSIEDVLKSADPQYVLQTLLHRPPLPFSVPLFNSLYIHTYSTSALNPITCRCFSCTFNSPDAGQKQEKKRQEAISYSSKNSLDQEHQHQSQLLFRSTAASNVTKTLDLFHPSNLNLYNTTPANKDHTTQMVHTIPNNLNTSKLVQTKAGELTIPTNNQGLLIPGPDYRPYGCLHGNCFCLSDEKVTKNLLKVRQDFEEKLKMIKTLENYQNLHDLASTQQNQYEFSQRHYGNDRISFNENRDFNLLGRGLLHHSRGGRRSGHNRQPSGGWGNRSNTNNDRDSGNQSFHSQNTLGGDWAEDHGHDYDNYQGGFDDAIPGPYLDGLPLRINPTQQHHRANRDAYHSNFNSVAKKGYSNQSRPDDGTNLGFGGDIDQDLSQNQSFFVPTSQFYQESDLGVEATAHTQYNFGSQSRFFHSKKQKRTRNARKQIRVPNEFQDPDDTFDEDGDYNDEDDDTEDAGGSITFANTVHNFEAGGTSSSPQPNQQLPVNEPEYIQYNAAQTNSAHVLQWSGDTSNHPSAQASPNFQNQLSQDYNIAFLPHTPIQPSGEARYGDQILPQLNQHLPRHQQEPHHQSSRSFYNQSAQPLGQQNHYYDDDIDLHQLHPINLDINDINESTTDGFDLDQLAANTTQGLMSSYGNITTTTHGSRPPDYQAFLFPQREITQNGPSTHQSAMTKMTKTHQSIPNFGEFKPFTFDEDGQQQQQQHHHQQQQQQQQPKQQVQIPLKLDSQFIGSTHSQQARRYEIELAQYTKNQEFLALFRDQLHERDQHQLSLYNELQQIRTQLDQLQQQIVYYEGVSNQISVAYQEIQNKIGTMSHQSGTTSPNPFHQQQQLHYYADHGSYESINQSQMGVEVLETHPVSSGQRISHQTSGYLQGAGSGQQLAVVSQIGSQRAVQTLTNQRQSISPREQAAGSLLLQNLQYSTQNGLIQQQSTGWPSGEVPNHATLSGASGHKTPVEQANHLQTTHKYCIQQLEAFTAHYLWLKVQAHTKLTQFKQLEQYLDLFKVEYNQKILQHQEAYVILETLYNNYQDALNLSREREETRMNKIIEGRVNKYLDKVHSNTFGGLINDPNNSMDIYASVMNMGSELYENTPNHSGYMHNQFDSMLGVQHYHQQEMGSLGNNSVLSMLFSRHYLPADYQHFQNFGQYTTGQQKPKKRVKFEQRVAVIDHDLLLFVPTGIDPNGLPHFEQQQFDVELSRSNSAVSQIDSAGDTMHNPIPNRLHNQHLQIDPPANNLDPAFYNSNGNPVLISYYEDLREEPGYGYDAVNGDGAGSIPSSDKDQSSTKPKKSSKKKTQGDSGAIDFTSEYNSTNATDLHSMFLRRREQEDREIKSQLDKNRQKLLKIIDRHTKGDKIIDLYGRTITDSTPTGQSTTTAILTGGVENTNHRTKNAPKEEPITLNRILSRLFGRHSTVAIGSKPHTSRATPGGKKPPVAQQIRDQRQITTTTSHQTLNITPSHLYTTLTLPVVQCQSSPVRAIVMAHLLQQAHNAVASQIPTHLHTHFGVLATLHRALFITPHALLAHFGHHYPIKPWFLDILPPPAYPEQLIRTSYYQKHPHLNPLPHQHPFGNKQNANSTDEVADDGFPYSRFVAHYTPNSSKARWVMARFQRIASYYAHCFAHHLLTPFRWIRSWFNSRFRPDQHTSTEDVEPFDSHILDSPEDEFTTLNKLPSSEMAWLTPTIPIVIPYIAFLILFVVFGSLWAGSISYLGSEVSEVEWLLCVFLSFFFDLFIFTPICAFALQFLIVDDGNHLRRYVARCQTVFLNEFVNSMEQLPASVRNLVKHDPQSAHSHPQVDDKLAYMSEKMVGAMLHFTIRKQQMIADERKKQENWQRIREREEKLQSPYTQQSNHFSLVVKSPPVTTEMTTMIDTVLVPSTQQQIPPLSQEISIIGLTDSGETSSSPVNLPVRLHELDSIQPLQNDLHSQIIPTQYLEQHLQSSTQPPASLSHSPQTSQHSSVDANTDGILGHRSNPTTTLHGDDSNDSNDSGPNLSPAQPDKNPPPSSADMAKRSTSFTDSQHSQTAPKTNPDHLHSYSISHPPAAAPFSTHSANPLGIGQHYSSSPSSPTAEPNNLYQDPVPIIPFSQKTSQNQKNKVLHNPQNAKAAPKQPSKSTSKQLSKQPSNKPMRSSLSHQPPHPATATASNDLPKLSLSSQSKPQSNSVVTSEDSRVYRQYLKLVHELAQCRCTCGADEMEILHSFTLHLARANQFPMFTDPIQKSDDNPIGQLYMSRSHGILSYQSLLSDVKPILSHDQHAKLGTHFTASASNMHHTGQWADHSTCGNTNSSLNGQSKRGHLHSHDNSCPSCSLFFNHHQPHCLKTKALFFISSIIHLALSRRFSVDNAIALWQHQKAAIKGHSLTPSALMTPIQQISTFSPLDSTSMIASCLNLQRDGTTNPHSNNSLIMHAAIPKANSNAPYPGHHAFACQSHLLDQLEPLLPILIDKFDSISIETLLVQKRFDRLSLQSTRFSNITSPNRQVPLAKLQSPIIFSKSIKHVPQFYQQLYHHDAANQLSQQQSNFQRKINLAQFQSRLRSRSPDFQTATQVLPQWYQELVQSHSATKQQQHFQTEPIELQTAFGPRIHQQNVSTDLLFYRLANPEMEQGWYNQQYNDHQQNYDSQSDESDESGDHQNYSSDDSDSVVPTSGSDPSLQPFAAAPQQPFQPRFFGGPYLPTQQQDQYLRHSLSYSDSSPRSSGKSSRTSLFHSHDSLPASPIANQFHSSNTPVLRELPKYNHGTNSSDRSFRDENSGLDSTEDYEQSSSLYGTDVVGHVLVTRHDGHNGTSDIHTNPSGEVRHEQPHEHGEFDKLGTIETSPSDLNILYTSPSTNSLMNLYPNPSPLPDTNQYYQNTSGDYSDRSPIGKNTTLYKQYYQQYHQDGKSSTPPSTPEDNQPVQTLFVSPDISIPENQSGHAQSSENSTVSDVNAPVALNNNSNQFFLQPIYIEPSENLSSHCSDRSYFNPQNLHSKPIPRVKDANVNDDDDLGHGGPAPKSFFGGPHPTPIPSATQQSLSANLVPIQFPPSSPSRSTELRNQLSKFPLPRVVFQSATSTADLEPSRPLQQSQPELDQKPELGTQPLQFNKVIYSIVPSSQSISISHHVGTIISSDPNQEDTAHSSTDLMGENLSRASAQTAGVFGDTRGIQGDNHLNKHSLIKQRLKREYNTLNLAPRPFLGNGNDLTNQMIAEDNNDLFSPILNESNNTSNDPNNNGNNNGEPTSISQLGASSPINSIHINGNQPAPNSNLSFGLSPKLTSNHHHHHHPTQASLYETCPASMLQQARRSIMDMNGANKDQVKDVDALVHHHIPIHLPTLQSAITTISSTPSTDLPVLHQLPSPGLKSQLLQPPRSRTNTHASILFGSQAGSSGPTPSGNHGIGSSDELSTEPVEDVIFSPQSHPAPGINTPYNTIQYLENSLTRGHSVVEEDVEDDGQCDVQIVNRGGNKIGRTPDQTNPDSTNDYPSIPSGPDYQHNHPMIIPGEEINSQSNLQHQQEEWMRQQQHQQQFLAHQHHHPQQSQQYQQQQQQQQQQPEYFNLGHGDDLNDLDQLNQHFHHSLPTIDQYDQEYGFPDTNNYPQQHQYPPLQQHQQQHPDQQFQFSQFAHFTPDHGDADDDADPNYYPNQEYQQHGLFGDSFAQIQQMHLSQQQQQPQYHQQYHQQYYQQQLQQAHQHQYDPHGHYSFQDEYDDEDDSYSPE